MIIVPSGERGHVVPQKGNQIFHTNTEHKYSSYGDQTKVSGFDLEVIGVIVYISQNLFPFTSDIVSSARRTRVMK